MKIYYFDPETGIYQGEGFADERLLSGSAAFKIPPHATELKPPEYGSGQAPYYNAKMKKWDVRDLSFKASAPGSPSAASRMWQDK
jgi:hypothetical protein